MPRWITAGSALLALIAAVGLASSASAQTFDPQLTEKAGVVQLVTADDDGAERKTKLWVVLIDGEAYLRTNASRWLANLKRDPAARLRIDGVEYPVMTEVLSDPRWVDRVDQASKEKYGWQETTIHIFRFKTPTIVRLLPMNR